MKTIIFSRLVTEHFIFYVASTLLILAAFAFSSHSQADSTYDRSPPVAPAVMTEENLNHEVPLMSSGFSLELHISMREKSKDTHGRSRSVTINNGQLSYRASHSGMDPRPDIEEMIHLSDDQQQKLIAYIIDRKLNRNLEEIKKGAKLGTSINISTKTQIGDKVTEASISGAYNDWMKIRQDKPPSNLDNLDYYHDIKGLLMFMRSKLGFDFIAP